jgi:NAD-dependent dihydropyrimidine dehydrogenase PreA subunit
MSEIKAEKSETNAQPVDNKPVMWHNIPRRSIEWYPTVDEDRCAGCGMCFSTCGKKVYAMEDGKAKVVNPYSCMVGCQTCMNLCLADAISFPDIEMIRKMIKEKDVLNHL